MFSGERTAWKALSGFLNIILNTIIILFSVVSVVL